jgi:hypothetical protein
MMRVSPIGTIELRSMLIRDFFVAGRALAEGRAQMLIAIEIIWRLRRPAARVQRFVAMSRLPPRRHVG